VKVNKQITEHFDLRINSPSNIRPDQTPLRVNGEGQMAFGGFQKMTILKITKSNASLERNSNMTHKCSLPLKKSSHFQ